MGIREFFRPNFKKIILMLVLYLLLVLLYDYVNCSYRCLFQPFSRIIFLDSYFPKIGISISLISDLLFDYFLSSLVIFIYYSLRYHSIKEPTEKLKKYFLKLGNIEIDFTPTFAKLLVLIFLLSFGGSYFQYRIGSIEELLSNIWVYITQFIHPSNFIFSIIHFPRLEVNSSILIDAIWIYFLISIISSLLKLRKSEDAGTK